MILIGRRPFLITVATLPGLGLLGCAPRQRERVLGALVRDISVPDTQQILGASEELSRALQRMSGQPTAVELEQARLALRHAALAWQAAYAFRNGPIIESRAFLRAAFWPARTDALREVLEGSDALNAPFMDALGVDVKGMFALEYLLFPAPQTASECPITGPNPARALAFARALADDALAHARGASSLLADGHEFEARFASAGQQSVNLVVNQMIGTIETATARRLEHVVATHRNGHLRGKEIQGAPSGLSSEIPRAWFATTQRIYLGTPGKGPGLTMLVAAAAPHVDEALQHAFAQADAALRQVDAPLEQLVLRDAETIVKAVDALKVLEMRLRTDLVSAIGVSLTFTASDGD